MICGRIRVRGGGAGRGRVGRVGRDGWYVLVQRRLDRLQLVVGGGRLGENEIGRRVRLVLTAVFAVRGVE